MRYTRLSWLSLFFAGLVLVSSAFGETAKDTNKKDKGPPEPKGPTPVRDSDHQVQIDRHTYIEWRNRNIVMQKRDFTCGAAALATIAKYYWDDNVDEDLFLRALDEILTDEEIQDRIKNGLAMSDMRRAAVKVGYQAVVGKTSFDKLMGVKVPVIVGIKPGGYKHFVVYRGVVADWVFLADPIRGNIHMPIWEFREQWQENAVLVIHKPGRKVKDFSALSLTEDDLNFQELQFEIVRTQESRMPQNKQMLPR